MFIVLKASVEPATFFGLAENRRWVHLVDCLHNWFVYSVEGFCRTNHIFGWADNKRMVHQYDTDFLNNIVLHLKSESFFSYIGCHIDVEGLSLTYYLSIAGGRYVGFMPSLKALERSKTLLYRGWTRLVVSISFCHARFNYSNNF